MYIRYTIGNLNTYIFTKDNNGNLFNINKNKNINWIKIHFRIKVVIIINFHASVPQNLKRTNSFLPLIRKDITVENLL